MDAHSSKLAHMLRCAFVLSSFPTQGPMGMRGDSGPVGPVGKPGHPVSFSEDRGTPDSNSC